MAALRLAPVGSGWLRLAPVIMGRVRFQITRSLAALLLIGTLPVFAADDHKGVNLYSVSQEIALGRQMAAEVEKQARLVDDPIVTEYINRLGQNITIRANAAFPVTVKMIDSDEINAFTLPGGFVYVNSAMMKMADNEAELASVIAHEIGHAAARHATRQATRGQLARVAALPLAVLIPGWGGLAGRQAANAAGPLVSNRFSRAFETEADSLGVRYLAEAGYDPNASIDMFERIASTERATPGMVSKLFLSHPPTRDRISKTQAEIRKLRTENNGYVLNTSEFEAVRTRLISGN
jgi:predicted Zn-dependent protease